MPWPPRSPRKHPSASTVPRHPLNRAPLEWTRLAVDHGRRDENRYDEWLRGPHEQRNPCTAVDARDEPGDEYRVGKRKRIGPAGPPRGHPAPGAPRSRGREVPASRRASACPNIACSSPHRAGTAARQRAGRVGGREPADAHGPGRRPGAGRVSWSACPSPRDRRGIRHGSSPTRGGEAAERAEVALTRRLWWISVGSRRRHRVRAHLGRREQARRRPRSTSWPSATSPSFSIRELLRRRIWAR